MSKLGPWGGDLTARAFTGSGDDRRDHERRAIRKVTGGVGKIAQGRVTEKINCANPKDNYGLKFTTNIVLLIAILACLIRLQSSKHIPCFESLDI